MAMWSRAQRETMGFATGVQHADLVLDKHVVILLDLEHRLHEARGTGK